MEKEEQITTQESPLICPRCSRTRFFCSGGRKSSLRQGTNYSELGGTQQNKAGVLKGFLGLLNTLALS